MIVIKYGILTEHTSAKQSLLAFVLDFIETFKTSVVLQADNNSIEINYKCNFIVSSK